MVTESLASYQRKDLTHKMQKMCDSLPIFKLEAMYQTLQEVDQIQIMPKMVPYINHTRKYSINLNNLLLKIYFKMLKSIQESFQTINYQHMLKVIKTGWINTISHWC